MRGELRLAARWLCQARPDCVQVHSYQSTVQQGCRAGLGDWQGCSRCLGTQPLGGCARRCSGMTHGPRARLPGPILAVFAAPIAHPSTRQPLQQALGTQDARPTLGRLRMAAVSATAHALVAQRPTRASRAQRRPVSAELQQHGGKSAPRGPAPPSAQAAPQQQVQVGLGARLDQGSVRATLAPVPPAFPLTDLPADRRPPHPRHRRPRRPPGKCHRRRRRSRAASAGRCPPPTITPVSQALPHPTPAAAGCHS